MPTEAEVNEEYRWPCGPAIDVLAEPVHPQALSGVLDRLAEDRYPPRPWSWGD